jgi:serine/threonine protein kinase
VLDRRFLILDRLGTGGMGEVYLAQHLVSERRCAIKLLRPELSTCHEHVERFLREARAVNRSAHPNVIELIDAGHLPDGTVYHAMELLEGEDLDSTLRRETRLPWSRVRHIALQICAALASAHARDIIHRDLKPANCFRITRDRDPDFIKVLDFGIAKLLDRAHTTLTGKGDLIGTLRYMAPEQAEGGEIDRRTDIYALGAMLYHLLTGRTAADGRTNVELLTSLLTRPPKPFPPDLELPPGVWPVVEKAMARNPDHRFASMPEFAAALLAIDSTPTVHPPINDIPQLTDSPPTPAIPVTPPRTLLRLATSATLLCILAIIIIVTFLRDTAPAALFVARPTDDPAAPALNTRSIPEPIFTSSPEPGSSTPPPSPKAPIPAITAPTNRKPRTAPTLASSDRQAKRLLRKACSGSLPETVHAKLHIEPTGAIGQIDLVPPHNIGRISTCFKNTLANVRFPTGLGPDHIEPLDVELGPDS